jgi:hypothetical protein
MYFLDSIEDKWFRLGIVTMFILLTFIIMYFGRDQIFRRILQTFWTPNSKDKKILGQWDIYIFFNKNKNFDRKGILYFEDSYAGLYVRGDKLTNTEGKITVEKWFAQDAEVHHFTDNRMILVYQYWLQDDETKDIYSKLGIVTAISDDGGNSFKGTFRDIALDSGETTRWGNVTINKCDRSVIGH